MDMRKAVLRVLCEFYLKLLIGCGTFSVLLILAFHGVRLKLINELSF
jgi:hypothetical protein